MSDGPADLGAPPPARPVMKSQENYDAVPSQERLARSSQHVTLKNNSQNQTHTIIDRYLQGVMLRPGETKELEMVVDEIENLRHWGRSDRGYYRYGPNLGRPFPPHPVQIIG